MIEALINILNTPMKEPELYGWFHLVWLVIPFIAAWLLCRSYKRSPQPQAHIRKTIFYTAVTVAIFEILHQINFNLTCPDGQLQWNTQWYSFPFQFCSTPMYVGLLTGAIKKGRVHDSLCAYLATYAVFAGLCVMLYPADVYIDVILINIQTMVCHASMLTIGIYLYFTGHVKTETRTLLRAMPVFGVCVAIAMLLNEIAYRSGLLASHTFNMFYFSPYCDPSLPVYSLVQAVVPYPLCLVVYVLVFTLAANLVLLSAKLIARLTKRRAAK